jgi:hypothetical protein
MIDPETLTLPDGPDDEEDGEFSHWNRNPTPRPPAKTVREVA